MNASRDNRFQRRAVQGTILLAALVGSAGVVLPGPAWAYLAAAAAVLAVGTLCFRGMARAILEFLGVVSPAVGWVLARRRRRLEYGTALRGVQRTLEHFHQPGLAEAQLEELAAEPPPETKDDVPAACHALARQLTGEDEIGAPVFELLHHDLQGDLRPALWHLVREGSHWPEQRRQLIRILGPSEGLGWHGDPSQRTRVLGWVLDRLAEFQLERLRADLGVLKQLRHALEAYAVHLAHSGLSEDHLAATTADRLGFLLSQLDTLTGGASLAEADRQDLVEEVLLAAGKAWIAAWAETQGELPKQDPVALARVYLGIYATELAAGPRPERPELAVHVARDDGALRMLFGYLWQRDKLRREPAAGSTLETLASHWPRWAKAADREMGIGLSNAVRGELRSELLNRKWPTILPVRTAGERLLRQVRRIDERLEDLRATVHGDPSQRAAAESLDLRVEETAVIVAAPDLDPLVRTIREALGELSRPAEFPDPRSMERVERALGELRSSLLPGGGADTTEHEARAELSDYAARFRQAPILDLLDSCRQSAIDLSRQLGELGQRLAAETGGGSAYVITFDQRYGPVADLLDSLADKYGFRHYTRYSRIGEVPVGKTFEELYRALEADLESVFRPVLRETIERATHAQPPDPATAGDEAGDGTIEHDPWEDIEITVQQISLLHRHDFAVDDAENLLTRIRDLLPQSSVGPDPAPSAEAVLNKVFRFPPSSAVLGSAAAGRWGTRTSSAA